MLTMQYYVSFVIKQFEYRTILSFDPRNGLLLLMYINFDQGKYK